MTAPAEEARPPGSSEARSGAHRPPRQKRSRQTLSRLLGAAEELLRDRPFDQLPIASLLDRAGISVGSFYARFESKEALLPFLRTRYLERAQPIADRVLAPERWAGKDLEQRARLLCRYVVTLYRRNRGLLRVLWLEGRTRPETLSAAAAEHRTKLYGRVADAFLECEGEIVRPHPAAAIQFACACITAICRDMLLPGPQPDPLNVQLDDRDFANDLADVMLGFLRNPPGSRAQS